MGKHLAALESSHRRWGARTVYINGRFFGQRITGVQRYSRETVLCLDELLTQSGSPAQWTLLLPRGIDMPALRAIKVESVGRLQGHLWEQLELAWRARDGLLVNFGPTGPLSKSRQIVTVHDAGVLRIPKAYSWRFRWWYRILIGVLVTRCIRTIAVSSFTAREAIECFGAPAERMRVTTEGWQHLERVEPDETILDRHGLRGETFALAVSSPTPNKNFAAIAEAMRILGSSATRCVVAGYSDPTVFRDAGEASAAMVRLGYVSDEELKALYRHASCFVFPSFYEGFGIPPLEAMACGCPVVASTADAVREVCGDAALYFDPHQPAELALRLREVLGEPALRKRMTAAGLARAQRYSWAESARLSLDYIEEVLCCT